jgi:YidC/Oxa1 family membrane protein insertase
MFTTLIVQPLFNLLTIIYALLPGHNFGLSLIIFTIVIRLLMWPLIKKQLHHAKAMRELQPEIKRIKKEAKGDRQKESLMIMALYKEREISPFGSIGVLVVQLVILIGLYSGLQRVVKEPKVFIDLAYPFIQDLSWLKTLAADIGQFDATLLGVVDLTKSAIGDGGIYWPAMLLVIGSAVSQFFQSKQLMPTDKDARGLRQILKEAGKGKQADNAEVNAAMGRGMQYFIPIMIFVFTIGLPSALGLYWFVSGVVAYWQQSLILKQDEKELKGASKDTKSKTYIKTDVIEGEVVETKKAKTAKKKSSVSNKRRKK